jgi:hypothetical protein
LEANPYLYADGDPINRVDPSGLLSNATIAATLGTDDFADVLDFFELRQEWAVLKLLQDADVGDFISGGILGQTLPSYTIECYDVSRPPRDSGPVQEGGIVLKNAFGYRYTLTDAMGEPASFTWANWYRLNRNTGLPAYTNRTDVAVLPDYVAVSGGPQIPIPEFLIFGVGVNGLGVIDRYGQIYWGFSFDAGIGLPIPVSGSVVVGWTMSRYPSGGMLMPRTIPSSTDLQQFISGPGGGIYGFAHVGK